MWTSPLLVYFVSGCIIKPPITFRCVMNSSRANGWSSFQIHIRWPYQLASACWPSLQWSFHLGAVTLISREMKNILDRITGLTWYYKKQESTVPVYHKSVSCNYPFISKPRKKYTLKGHKLLFDISYKLELELSLY